MSPRLTPAAAHELSRIGLLAALPGERLMKLAAAMTREEVPVGTEIAGEGELGGRFYVVLAGLLSASKAGLGERRLLRPGDCFGGAAAALGERGPASVRAVTPATVASCDQATFDEFVKPLLTQAD